MSNTQKITSTLSRSLTNLPESFRFLVVGGAGTALDFGTFTLLANGIGLPVLLANVIAYSVGIINNYYWHSHWTYRSRVQNSSTVSGQKFGQFLLVSITALLVNSLILSLLTALPQSMIPQPLWILFAKAAATGITLLWNFTLNHFWVFRSKNLLPQPALES